MTLTATDIKKVRHIIKEETVGMREDISDIKEDVFDIKENIHYMQQNMLTKEDAKDFATKDDLKNFLTKEDATGIAVHTANLVMEKMRDHFRLFSDKIL